MTIAGLGRLAKDAGAFTNYCLDNPEDLAAIKKMVGKCKCIVIDGMYYLVSALRSNAMRGQPLADTIAYATVVLSERVAVLLELGFDVMVGLCCAWGNGVLPLGCRDAFRPARFGCCAASQKL